MPLLLWMAPSMPGGIQVPATAATVSEAPARVARNFPWMFAIWAAGASLLFARLIVGIGRIAWITKNATRRDGVYYSDRVSTPLTWGSFIVMPEWNEIAVRHELAHVERGDWMWQTFARMVTAVFWFHPLVWIADRAMRREAELAVDDRVVASGADPAEYASVLLGAALSMNPAAVAMVGTSALETRVRAILDPARPLASAGKLARVMIAVAAIALTLPISAFQERKVYKIADGVTPPRVLTKVEPSYTQEAKDAKIEGTTVLRCVIDEAGIAENIEVARSLDAGLDAQAVIAVSNWKFAPGEKDGKVVPVQATIEINFKLK